jgi:hypothetical protein
MWLELVYVKLFFAGFRNASLTFQRDILAVLQRKLDFKLTRVSDVVSTVMTFARSHLMSRMCGGRLFTSSRHRRQRGSLYANVDRQDLEGVERMRRFGSILAVVALSVASAAYGQVWSEYENRQEFFAVNFPSDPVRTTSTFKTSKGTTLPATVFTATAPASSITAGKYIVTVVNYSSAPTEGGQTALDDAAKMILARGESKYDGVEHTEQIRSRRLTVETETKRWLAEIMYHEGRLYIIEADTAIDVVPPAQFQASIEILDDKGNRIRYRSVGSTERVR